MGERLRDPVRVCIALRRAVGAAFSVGYLSHIVGDGLYPLVVHGEVSPGYMLWPLVSTPVDDGPFFATVEELWTAFVHFLGTPRGQLYLALDATFLALALALWLWDGTPGLPRPGRERA